MDGWSLIREEPGQLGEGKMDLLACYPHLRPFFSISLGQRSDAALEEVASSSPSDPHFRGDRLNFDRVAVYENFPRFGSYGVGVQGLQK